MKNLYKKLCLAINVWLLVFANQSHAQDGITTSFAFGGGATTIDEMRYATDGDLYFVARMGGKNTFAGVNYDAGGYNQYPLQQWLFGKVSTNGQQSMLKVFDRNASNTNLYNSLGGNQVIDKDGNLISVMTSTFPDNNYGDGHVETAFGARIAKTNKNGVVQWVKPINTGVSINYGEAGTTLPNVNGLQVMDDGSVYLIISANYKITDSGSPYVDKYPTRIIKFNANGDEVWHHEIFADRNALGFLVSAPKQFVDNNGNLVVTVTIPSSHPANFISGGTTLTATNPYGGNYWCLIGLDNTGNRKWFHSAGLGANFRAVDPNNGTVYVAYNYSGANNTPPAIAPYNTLPNINPAYPLVNSYMWRGMLKLDITTGNITNAIANLPATGNNNFLTEAEKLHVRADGSLVFYEHKENFSAIGDYLVPDNYNAIIFTDANYGNVKVSQALMPKVEMIAENNTNFAIAGGFNKAFTLNSGTVTPFVVDTDFDTRFPLFAAAKTDTYIAQGEIGQIAAPKITKWTGATSTEWNDATNWSNGIADIVTIAEFDANVANQPTVSATTTVAKIIINNGVTATLPASNLTIKNKLVINGTLKIPVSGYTTFSGYNSPTIDGNGTLDFDGTTGPATSSYFGTFSQQLNIKTNVPLNISGTFKTLEFAAENTKITGTIALNNTDANAIIGASTTSYIVGKLTQNIASGTVYNFPVGRANYYLPVSINTNNITGTTALTVEPKTTTITKPDVNLGGTTIDRVTNNGVWTITPDVQPTSGTYSITLNKNNATNGDAYADKYVVLKTTPNSSLYSFEGSLGSRSQTGGTVSGQNLQNSAISVTQNDLETFNDYIIAVTSAAITPPLTISNSTWTGTANTEWNNAANWSNGIPSSTVNATIPAGAANYPLSYNATKSYLKSLTINAGVNVNLSDRLIVSGTVTNNGIITVNTTPNANSALPVRAALNGSGKVVFEKPKTFSDSQAYTGNIDCDLEINIGNANTMNINGTIGGNVKVISGIPGNSNVGNMRLLIQPNASTTLQVSDPINHISAVIRKTITENGTFDFPIGNYLSSSYSGGRKYGAITITNHNIAPTTQYEVWFNNDNSTFKARRYGDEFIRSSINSGYWTIQPDVVATTGTIDLVLKTSNYTNGRADVNDYVLVRENNTASAAWSLVQNAIITENAGTITVTANGLAPISTTGETRFYIGLKATTTTWTGTANNGDWNTAANWSNGVPTANEKAIFNNSATNFPTSNIPTLATAAAAVEVQNGTTITLPTSLKLPIINNGTIEVQGTETFYGFGSGSSFIAPTGSGTLKFTANSPNVIDGRYISYTIPNSIEINNITGVSQVGNLSIGGNLNLTNGIFTVPNWQTLYITNPTAAVTGNANAYINGTLNRTVNASGSYVFPVGSATAYAPATLQLNNIVGPTTIPVKYSSDAIQGQPNLTIGANTVNSLLAGGSWEITPSLSLTGGSYDVSLSAPLGSSTAGSFVVLKRPYNYDGVQWENQGTNQASTVNDGVVTASVTGLTAFSQFGIGELPAGTLPVKLVKFTAKAESNSVLINWETAQEVNNKGFELERSADGKIFLPLGDVASKGNSNTLTVYTLHDKNPLNGTSYYRLKQIDLDGKITELGIRQATLNLTPYTLHLYPNPVSSILNFSGLNDKNGTVNWYNINGQKIGESIIENDKTAMPAHLSNGLYFIKISLSNGTVISNKVNVYR